MGNYPVNVPKPGYCTGPSLANFGYWCTSAGLTNDDGVTRLALYLAGLRGARCRREEMLFCLEASKRVISLHVLLTGLCSRALAVVSSLSLSSKCLSLSIYPSSALFPHLLLFTSIPQNMTDHNTVVQSKTLSLSLYHLYPLLLCSAVAVNLYRLVWFHSHE